MPICMKEYYGCKCIITEHTSKILTGRLNKTEKEVLAKCINGSSKFICVSQNLKKCVQEITGSKKRIDVYPNLVNQIFQYENKQESPFIFTSIGNLIPLKRMDLLIESFCESFSEKENVRLEIYGSGVEYEKLRKIIINKRREKQIILHGSVSREEIAVSLKKSHVMALISEKETFGVAYVEALASGNVVIGANNGGANDIISDENGMIVNSSEIRDVSEVLRKAYETYLQYNPKKSVKNVLKNTGKEHLETFIKNYSRRKFRNERKKINLFYYTSV